MRTGRNYKGIQDVTERTATALAYTKNYVDEYMLAGKRMGFHADPSSMHVPYCSADDADRIGAKVVSVLGQYGVKSRLHGVECGPVVIRVNVEPEVGVRVSTIEGLADEIALAMRVSKVSVVLRAEIGCVAVDLPNKDRQSVRPWYINRGGLGGKALPIELGVGVTGEPYALDLAKAPHMLIAGQTGSGKSVCINSIVMSLLLNVRADRFDFMMVDPKGVELGGYGKLPNLVNGRVLVGAEESVQGLGWLVTEMERRYGVLMRAGKRNISDFNKAIDNGEVGTGMRVEDMERMRYVVCIVDEFADLMLGSGEALTEIMMRLAQKSRAVGIHVILATQRPSVKVVTGDLKANLTTRICFKVASQVDSRTVLDRVDAANLLGAGDMLVMTPSGDGLDRVHGVYYTDGEIDGVTGMFESVCRKGIDRIVDFCTGKETYVAEDGSELNMCGAMLSGVADGNDAVLSELGKAYRIDMDCVYKYNHRYVVGKK